MKSYSKCFLFILLVSLIHQNVYAAKCNIEKYDCKVLSPEDCKAAKTNAQKVIDTFNLSIICSVPVFGKICDLCQGGSGSSNGTSTDSTPAPGNNATAAA